MTENEQDIELLRTDPNRLIVRYQKHIRIIVKQSISYGWFSPSEFHDLTQAISLELLANIVTIRQQYNGTTFLRTYVSRIAFNFCRKRRKDHPVWDHSESLSDVAGADGDHILENLVIDETRDAVRTALSLYGPRLPKIALFIKILCRLPILAKDVLKCYPHCPDEDLKGFLRLFSKKYRSLLDTEIMEKLAPFVNKMEGSSTSPDGYRRWIDAIIQEICDLLNGDPPQSCLTRENILLLFEDNRLPVWGKKGYIHLERGQRH